MGMFKDDNSEVKLGDIIDVDEPFYVSKPCGVCKCKSDWTIECTQSGETAWAQWSEWSECSATCGNGYKKRSRAMTEPKCNTEVEEEHMPCSSGCCPEACVVSKWSQWTDCAVNCQRKRERSIEKEAKCGGDCNEDQPLVEYKCCPKNKCTCPEGTKDTKI